MTSRFVVAVAVVMALGSPARAADTVTIGLYAPTVAFDGPVERLDYVSELASHIATAVGADEGVGRVYSRSADFDRAIKRGDIDYAVVDAAYLAGRGLPYQVLAAAKRNGAVGATWQLVAASAIDSVLDLERKRLAVAGTGSKTTSFVLDVLFEGELDTRYFKKVSTSPDAVSAVDAVVNKKADAALVPTGTPVPAELSVVATLRSTPWPALVSLGTASEDRDSEVGRAAASFSSTHALSGFVAGGAAAFTELAGAFGRVGKKLGPMIAPRRLLDIKALLGARVFAVPRPSVADFGLPPP